MGTEGTPGSEHLEVLRHCCLRVAGVAWGTQALVSPASQAAADARGRTERPQSAAASRIIGISLQEAQQILNVSSLNPEEIQKVETSWSQGGMVLAGPVLSPRVLLCMGLAAGPLCCLGPS